MIYDFRCMACGHMFEVVCSLEARSLDYYCPKCHSQAYRTFSAQMGINSGKGGRIPGWCHSLDEKPVFIQSKHQLKEECKKRGLTPRNL